MFEPMNEPHRATRGGWIWDTNGRVDRELARRINHFNSFALDLIRKSGGFNDKRIVITTSMGAQSDAVPYYEHPADEYAALGIFYYPQHTFAPIVTAHNAGIPIYVKETAPILDLENERAAVSQAQLTAWIKEHYGKFSQMGIPIAFWNCAGDTAWELFNRGTGEWNMPLVNSVFEAFGKTAGQTTELPSTFPHELTLLFDGDSQLTWRGEPMFNSAEKLVVEHTGEIPRFAFVYVSPPAWEWTQFSSWDNDPRITREDGKMTFDLRGIAPQDTYIFAVWDQDGWQDLITRAYLDVF
jgi:hypothetical protein